MLHQARLPPAPGLQIPLERVVRDVIPWSLRLVDLWLLYPAQALLTTTMTPAKEHKTSNQRCSSQEQLTLVLANHFGSTPPSRRAQRNSQILLIHLAPVLGLLFKG